MFVIKCVYKPCKVTDWERLEMRKCHQSIGCKVTTVLRTKMLPAPAAKLTHWPC